ncbi:MAG: hemerythrin domain-containing protein [Polyangiaceae bacterium]|nr:hemerythrin domain-containing protein [Polyangiaceae bacterium]
MRPTQELGKEQRDVHVALQLLERIGAALDAKQEHAPAHLGQLLDYLTGFVDRCHFGKESVLFPELERRGVEREGGPIGVMLAEHHAGRGYVRDMLNGLDRLQRGDPGAVTGIRENAGAYRDLLRTQIRRENKILFPMADRLIPDDVAATLMLEFEAIERAGAAKHDGYQVMLHTLKDFYGVA